MEFRSTSRGANDSRASVISVARIPEAAPRACAGTEFMMDSTFGEAKRPLPRPMTKIMTAKGT